MALRANAQQRQITMDQVKSPDLLYKFLLEVGNGLNRLQAAQQQLDQQSNMYGAAGTPGIKPGRGAPGNAESGRDGVAGGLAASGSDVLSGVKSGPAALVQLGIDSMATVKNNLASEVAPTTDDDASLGYGRGSFWVDLTGPDVYFCVDPRLTDAIWIQLY